MVTGSANTIPDNKSSENSLSKESVRESLWSEVSEQLFVAAGVTAKDKRIKDAKNVAASLLKDKVSSLLGKKSGSFCSSVSGISLFMLINLLNSQFKIVLFIFI